MEPQPGLTVTNSLRLVRELGAGGMGSVWIADHLGLDTQVAVKFIFTELAKKHPRLVERFKREAAAAAKIRSPHVVQVFDHGLTEDGTPYIAMELLQGESLDERLEREGRLPLDMVAIIVTQTAQVLQRAHDLNIVHRDIKPANLFLEDAGYDVFVKVLDFGIAKHVDAIKEVSVTATGSMLGSPLYMSPEQFTSAKGVDHRADLWSLAVLVYHALSGRPAFVGETLGQVMMSVMHQNYQHLTELRPEMPKPLDDFFSRAFAADIDHRFQNAIELDQAFQSLAQQLSSPGADGSGAFGQPGSSVGGSRTSALPHMPATVVGAPANPQGGVGAVTNDPNTSAGYPAVGPVAGTFEPASRTLSGKPAGGRVPLAIGGLVLAIAGGGALLWASGSGDPAPAADAADEVADEPAEQSDEPAETPEPEREPPPTGSEGGGETTDEDAADDGAADDGEPAAPAPRPSPPKPAPVTQAPPKPRPAPPKPKPAPTQGEKDYGF